MHTPTILNFKVQYRPLDLAQKHIGHPYQWNKTGFIWSLQVTPVNIIREGLGPAFHPSEDPPTSVS